MIYQNPNPLLNLNNNRSKNKEQSLCAQGNLERTVFYVNCSPLKQIVSEEGACNYPVV